MRLLSLAPPFCGSLHAGGGRAGGREAGKEAGKEGWREGDAGGAGGEGHTCRRGGRGEEEEAPGVPSRGPRRQLQDRCGHSWRRHPAPRPQPHRPSPGKRRPRRGRCAHSWTDPPPPAAGGRASPPGQMCRRWWQQPRSLGWLWGPPGPEPAGRGAGHTGPLARKGLVPSGDAAGGGRSSS